jgi:hypothetical protein
VANSGSSALPPGHPALQEPLQYLTALDGLLRSLMHPDELERLRRQAERELQDPGRWGLDFTLVQCWACVEPREPVR